MTEETDVQGNVLTGKDTEIARLKKICEDKDHEIDRLSYKCCELAARPHYLNGPWDRLHKTSTEIDHLKDEINKRNEILQDHSIKFAELSKENNRLLLKANDLEKALQEAMKKQCAHYPCGMTMGVGDGSGQLFVHGNYESIKALQKLLLDRQSREEPPKDEPELWICDHAARCNIEICNHIRPHKHLDGCDKPTCDLKKDTPVKCIPYKKEPTVPETQQPARRENTVAGALHYDIEVQGRRIDAYAKKQIDFDERLDALEIASKAHDQINSAHGKMIQDLQAQKQPAPRLGEWDVQPHLTTLTAEISKIKARLDKLEKE